MVQTGFFVIPVPTLDQHISNRRLLTDGTLVDYVIAVAKVFIQNYVSFLSIDELSGGDLLDHNPLFKVALSPVKMRLILSTQAFLF
jgi:hypothetical protein